MTTVEKYFDEKIYEKIMACDAWRETTLLKERAWCALIGRVGVIVSYSGVINLTMYGKNGNQDQTKDLSVTQEQSSSLVAMLVKKFNSKETSSQLFLEAMNNR
jgi:hypothetical protein